MIILRPNEPTTGTPLSWTPHETVASVMPFQCASQILTQAAVRFRTHCGRKARHDGCGMRQARQERTAASDMRVWSDQSGGANLTTLTSRRFVWHRASHRFARSADGRWRQIFSSTSSSVLHIERHMITDWNCDAPWHLGHCYRLVIL